jgi:hypothetical protein
MDQFIGDYIGIVAGPTGAYLVWPDACNATPCPAVGAYRSAVYSGSRQFARTRDERARRTRQGLRTCLKSSNFAPSA